MLIKLLKTYTIRVTLQEGNDEFWESFGDRSGADEVLEEVRRCLADHGFIEPGCYCSLEKFEEAAPQVYVRAQD